MQLETMEVNKRVARPFKNLDELYNEIDSLVYWPGIYKLRKSVDYVYRGTDIDAEIDRPERLQRDGVPKTIVCHDLMGGYLEDKFIDGSNEHNSYHFYHWSVIDTFIYFSHYFVTIPPFGWINSAHRHGVKILGTLITESTEGKEIWNKILKTRESITKFADALILLAQFYKFEGWLLNVENEINEIDVTKLTFFVQYLTENIHQKIEDSEIIWYDSVTKTGKLSWQNELNEKNECFFDSCDGIFLNYTWSDSGLIKSAICAQRNNRVKDIYVGLDVWGRGCPGGGGFNSAHALQRIREQGLSVAIFAPAWTFEYFGAETFPRVENIFWAQLMEFLYIHVPIYENERFITTFCRGAGIKYYEYGMYMINNVFINYVDYQKDLGITFESSFKFNLHLDISVAKAFKTLGFILRSAKDFKNVNTLLYLYKTLVLPSLLYGSQIWTPHYNSHITKLESVQHKFLRYISYKMGQPMAVENHDYTHIASLVGLGSVKSLHNFYDLALVRNIISNFITCSELIDLFSFRELTYELRNPRSLAECSASTNYIFYSAVNRMTRMWNNLPVQQITYQDPDTHAVITRNSSFYNMAMQKHQIIAACPHLKFISMKILPPIIKDDKSKPEPQECTYETSHEIIKVLGNQITLEDKPNSLAGINCTQFSYEISYEGGGCLQLINKNIRSYHRLFFIYVGFSREIQARIIHRDCNAESPESNNKNNPVLLLGNSFGVTSFLPRETIQYGLGWKMSIFQTNMKTTHEIGVALTHVGSCYIGKIVIEETRRPHHI